jgi:hypothetical protein
MTEIKISRVIKRQAPKDLLLTSLISLGALRELSPAEGVVKMPQALECGGDFPLYIKIRYVIL